MFFRRALFCGVSGLAGAMYALDDASVPCLAHADGPAAATLSPNSFSSCPLVGLAYETPDTKRLTFRGRLPSSDAMMCVIAQGRPADRSKGKEGIDFQRAYIPVAQSDDEGTFDVLVQRVKKGPVSTWLHALSAGESVEFKGTFPFMSEGNMLKNPPKQVVLVADGVLGIAAVYPIVRQLHQINADTHVTLVYGSRSVSELALVDEIVKVKKDVDERRAKAAASGWFKSKPAPSFRLDTYFTVESASWGWQGGYGPVYQPEMLRHIVGTPETDGATVIVAGDSNVSDALEHMLVTEVGWSKDAIKRAFA
eukprot:PhM_4_TR16379/c0_g1_i1/m.77366/K00326/E1.6.2.2; cytochrome-b5 reductase